MATKFVGVMMAEDFEKKLRKKAADAGFLSLSEFIRATMSEKIV